MFKFFGNILNVFNSWTGNYMLALLLFALMVKIITLPLSIMQQKNQIKGAKLRPKMLLIEKKYAGRNDQVTLKKKQAEIMELQQKEGYSAFSGCLPLLIQFPIIIILYRVIQKPLTYVSHLGEKLATIAEKIGFTESFKSSEISLLSQIRQNMDLAQEGFVEAGGTGNLADLLPKMSFFGADLTVRPFFWSILLLIPVINFGLGVLTMKLSKKLSGNMAQLTAQTQDQKVSGGIMEWMMPVVSLWFAFILPSALGVYWIYQSVLSIIQMLILAKVMPMPKYTDEEMEQILKELKKRQVERPAYTGSTYSGDRPRSLHHIDDDDEFPEDKKPTGNSQNQRKKRGRPTPAPSDKKLKPEDFAEKPESEPEETAAEETVTATPDLEDLVNAIGAENETADAEEKKED
ncbi:MAG: YidC/Oxa1 family membrane protein insertase [Clostridia bacterium]|nr:YidC/Oxa1 family membrane protein insertase [Clostridia bacterium]